MAKKKLLTLAKELDFLTESEFFNYLIESIINGNFNQAKNLFYEMKRDDQKFFLAWIKDQMPLNWHEKKSFFDFFFEL